MDKIAVLIPCYNEALTIEKVVTDWKNALPEATPRMIPLPLQKRPVPLSATNSSRARAMSSAGCSGKSTPNVM